MSTVAHDLTVGPSFALKRQKQTKKEPHSTIVSIPFVEGLSQELRRITDTTGVRCAFPPPNTLFSLYTSKNRLPTDSITIAAYSAKWKTYSGEYAGETCVRYVYEKKEHCDAIRLELSSKSAIAEP